MIDWHKLFMPEVPLLETFLRGSIMYLVLLLIMRFGKNRTMGTIGVSDMLLIVVIADAAQNAMAGDHSSLVDGILLVLTVVFWAWLLDLLCFKFPKLEEILQPRKVCLIKNGRFKRRNMHREYITHEELMAQLRVNGVDDVKKVKEACIEANGEVSVIRIKD